MKLSTVLAPALLATLAAAAACGGSTTTGSTGGPTGPTGPAERPTVASLSWFVGDWLGEDERTAEHWVAGPDILWGVSLADDGFEVMRIDASGPDGALVFVPAINGPATVSFTHAPDGKPDAVTFTNPGHDDPTAVTYEHHDGAGPTSEALRATLVGPEGTRTFHFTAMSDAPAAPPEVLAALGSRPNAVIRSWRSLPEGHLAGTVAFVGMESYVAIWKRGADGTWAPIYQDRRP